jgi:hypothetical protein
MKHRESKRGLSNCSTCKHFMAGRGKCFLQYADGDAAARDAVAQNGGGDCGRYKRKGNR